MLKQCLTFCVLAALTACESHFAANTTALETRETASPPAMPKIINLGGRVLTSPKLVPVFFDADPLRPQLTTFISGLPGSTYWTATTAEYGVGPASAEAPVILSEPPPPSIDDLDIQAWLEDKTAHDPRFAGGGPDTIFTIFYPAGTTVTFDDPGGTGKLTGCHDWTAYHKNTASDPTRIYTVSPRCDSNPIGGAYTPLDTTTHAASHEIIEAVTDPVGDKPAWDSFDEDHIIWGTAFGGPEVGDPCALSPQSALKLDGVGVVQRMWSNQSAAAGHSPCVPVPPGEAYFVAAPVLRDTFSATLLGRTFTTQSVQVPVGGSKTIDVDFTSDVPTPPWKVEILERPLLGFGPPSGALTFAWDGQACASPSTPETLFCETHGNSGDVHKLTISVDSALSHGAATVLLMSSVRGSDGAFSFNPWAFVVSN